MENNPTNPLQKTSKTKGFLRLIFRPTESLSEIIRANNVKRAIKIYLVFLIPLVCISFLWVYFTSSTYYIGTESLINWLIIFLFGFAFLFVLSLLIFLVNKIFSRKTSFKQILLIVIHSVAYTFIFYFIFFGIPLLIAQLLILFYTGFFSLRLFIAFAFIVIGIIVYQLTMIFVGIKIANKINRGSNIKNYDRKALMVGILIPLLLFFGTLIFLGIKSQQNKKLINNAVAGINNDEKNNLNDPLFYYRKSLAFSEMAYYYREIGDFEDAVIMYKNEKEFIDKGVDLPENQKNTVRYLALIRKQDSSREQLDTYMDRIRNFNISQDEKNKALTECYLIILQRYRDYGDGNYKDIIDLGEKLVSFSKANNYNNFGYEGEIKNGLFIPLSIAYYYQSQDFEKLRESYINSLTIGYMLMSDEKLQEIKNGLIQNVWDANKKSFKVSAVYEDKENKKTYRYTDLQYIMFVEKYKSYQKQGFSSGDIIDKIFEDENKISSTTNAFEYKTINRIVSNFSNDSIKEAMEGYINKWKENKNRDYLLTELATNPSVLLLDKIRSNDKGIYYSYYSEAGLFEKITWSPIYSFEDDEFTTKLFWLIYGPGIYY